MNTAHKIVVFDLDETLGYFTQFGIFCDSLNKYFKNDKYSDIHFVSLLDLYPEFLRPIIIKILKYLKIKKGESKCYKIMIYTNNQGPKSWAIQIKDYFNSKIEYNLFDQIIAAFKVKGTPVELGRTSHNKTIDDFVRCTKISNDVQLCFIDDVYHPGMVDDSVYYINVKAYKHSLTFDYMIQKYLNSKLGENLSNKIDFIKSMNDELNRYNYVVNNKTKNEQDIDKIVGKKIIQHLKNFFDENTYKTHKRAQTYKKNIKNKTLKKSVK
jgi:hypothetical protein